MKKAETNHHLTMIRDFREDDYASLKQLWKVTGLALPERKDDAAVIKRCNDMGGRLLVLEKTATGEIIGSSWMTWFTCSLKCRYLTGSMVSRVPGSV